MAEDYTPLLKLVQPDVGGSNNTWGDSLNDNILAIDALYRDRGGRPLTSADPEGSVHNYDYAPAYIGGSSTPGDPTYVGLASNLFIRVRIDKANDGAIAINYDTKGTKPVRKLEDGNFVHLVKGDLPKDYFAEFLYNASLLDAYDLPGGAWICLNPSTATSAGGGDVTSSNQLCPHNNLTVEGINDTRVRVKADTVILRSTDGERTKKFSGGIQVDADTAVAGAGGMHGFALAANAWYTLYLIGKTDDTLSAIMSPTNGGPGPTGGKWTGTVDAVNTVPPLPSGYTFYGFVGCVRTDASKKVVDFHQVGNFVTIMDLTGQPANRSSTSYTNVVLNLCPPEALAVRLGVEMASVGLGGDVGEGTFVTLEARVTPQGSSTNPEIGEIVIAGVCAQGSLSKFQQQVTVGLRTAQTVFARTPNPTLATTFQLRVHGYYL